MYKRGIILLCFVSSLICKTVHPNTGWRNDGTGLYPGTSPVVEWSTSKNVIWKTPLSDWGNSMPILVGDLIFLNTEPENLVCISSKTGKILWQKSTTLEDAIEKKKEAPKPTPAAQTGPKLSAEELTELKGKRNSLTRRKMILRRKVDSATGEDKVNMQNEVAELQKQIDELSKVIPKDSPKPIGTSRPRTQSANGYSTPTPVSDGQNVYVCYGTGIVAAYDLEGNRKWVKLHEQPNHQWGHSASPRLVDGKLIIHILNMMALNPQTGEKIWEAPARENWGTSAVGRIGDTKIIATPSGDILRISDGKKLKSNIFRMPYGSPIIHDGVLYNCDDTGAAAHQLPSTIEGDTIELKKLWISRPQIDRYYSSPVIVDDILYVINRRGNLSAINIANGDVIFSWRLQLGGGDIYGSLSYAGENIYVGGNSGQVAVFKPGQNFSLIGMNYLESTRSTPIFSGNKIFFRTDSNLYCLGSKLK